MTMVARNRGLAEAVLAPLQLRALVRRHPPATRPSGGDGAALDAAIRSAHPD
jgi:hypothetical protein